MMTVPRLAAALLFLAWQADPAPPRSPESVRVAGIVLKWIRADKAANYARAEPLIRQAAAQGARIVVTTECFLDGYAVADKTIPLEDYRALGEPIPEGPYYKRLAALARELRIHLVAGMLEADGEARYNTAVLIGPDGALVGRYHKHGTEGGRTTGGDSSPVFATPWGRAGLLICADRRNPELVRRFRENGADFLICASGGLSGPKNDEIVQARSRENKLPIVFVHPCEFLVTGPDGSILKRDLPGGRMIVASDQAVGEPGKVFHFDLNLKASAKEDAGGRDPSRK